MNAFAPIIGKQARLLVLGSMPGVTSLEQQQYYAHPRNSFWWIMSQLYRFDIDLAYSQRCDALIKSNVAVWDVLYDCQRPGSLDSAIERASERANDFEFFFENTPSIKRVIFNGAASHVIFKRHHKNLLQRLVSERDDFKWSVCPSTSPAHASVSKHDKLRVWRDAHE